jgi:HEPN domain-containing protein
MKPVTKAWLIKAGEDLDAIRVLRLKAVAEERTGTVPRVHDLRRLWETIADQFHQALDIDLLRELTDVYTDCRYPGDLGLMPLGKPTSEDAVRFEQFAEHVHTTVLSMLS